MGPNTRGGNTEAPGLLNTNEKKATNAHVNLNIDTQRSITQIRQIPRTVTDRQGMGGGEEAVPGPSATEHRERGADPRTLAL